MWTVGRPFWNSAMPRLPRVISTAVARVLSSTARPARSSARALSPIRVSSACSTSDSFGVQAVMPRNFNRL